MPAPYPPYRADVSSKNLPPLSQASALFDPVSPTILPPAAVTTPPSPCCSYTANEVIFQLSTTITIPDYRRYYNSPIEAFAPTYYALPDGSLVTPTYISDLKDAYSDIILLCVLIVVFFRNIFVSGDYIWRGKVKKKGIFLLLLASQILGPVVLLPLLVAYFHDYIDCTAIYILASCAYFVSISILVTGILGVKAYLCLDQSRGVGIMLIIIQIAWLTFAVLDVTHLHGERHLSGECDRATSGTMPIMVVLQCVQSCFISCCFLFAVWKSSGIPAARGRMSLRLYSMNHLDETHSSHSGINVKDVGETTQPRRGWWDYVPENEKPAPSSQRRAVGIAHGFHSALLRTLGRIWTKREDSNITVTRKPSLHSELPLTQLHRPLPVKISDKPTSQVEDRGERSRAHSPIPSFTNYDIWLRPRMVLFREVMRDELCYTTFVTTLCVAVTVLDVVGVHSAKVLNAGLWLMLNWAVVSLLAVHSFGRVIKRHEIEAMMQHPWSWDRSFQPDRRGMETSRRARRSQPWSSTISISSRRSRRNAAIGSLGRDAGDNVEDNIRLYPYTNGDDSVSISSLPSLAHSIDGSSLKVPLHDAPGIRHSSFMDEFQ